MDDKTVEQLKHCPFCGALVTLYCDWKDNTFKIFIRPKFIIRSASILRLTTA